MLRYLLKKANYTLVIFDVFHVVRVHLHLSTGLPNLDLKGAPVCGVASMLEHFLLSSTWHWKTAELWARVISTPQLTIGWLDWQRELYSGVCNQVLFAKDANPGAHFNHALHTILHEENVTLLAIPPGVRYFYCWYLNHFTSRTIS